MAAAARNKGWDLVMMALLLGSVALVFVYEGLDASHASAKRILEWVDAALVAFFLVEWIWRVRKSPLGPRAYAAAHAWELLGMVPILLPLPSFLRALRLVRLVRIIRVFDTVGDRFGVWERVAKDGHLAPIAYASAGVTAAGAVLVWLFERENNADFVNFSEALWWAIVTVTTVGYGDITPDSAPGRFIAAMLMITGIGIIGLLASTLATALLARETGDDDAAAASALPAADLADQLERVSRLHHKGALTQEEFKAAKALLLTAQAASPEEVEGA